MFSHNFNTNIFNGSFNLEKKFPTKTCLLLFGALHTIGSRHGNFLFSLRPTPVARKSEPIVSIKTSQAIKTINRMKKEYYSININIQHHTMPHLRNKTLFWQILFKEPIKTSSSFGLYPKSHTYRSKRRGNRPAVSRETMDKIRNSCNVSN